MPKHTEKPQTPKRLASLATELRDFAAALERAGDAMTAMGIAEMPLPRAAAEKIGFAQLRTFSDTARDVVRDVGHEMAGGLDRDKAIEKVLSGFREGPTKQREKRLSKRTKKNEPDKTKNDLTPISKAS